MGLFKKKEYREINPVAMQNVQPVPEIEPKVTAPSLSVSDNKDRETILELAEKLEELKTWVEGMIVYISKRV